jgi:hypothetical protein
MKKIDKIIKIFREHRIFKEDAMVVGNGGYTSSGDQTKSGFDVVMGFVRRKKVIGLGKNSRNRWKPKKPEQ